ncbi:MAG: fumarylacetoacetate hydrolase family protein [Pigmentiphaga sp.]|nr:fumarylacetoacetate hydrolase family protein [Pigmentiphaga sp.]
MKLASRANGRRDGELMLVSHSGDRWSPAGDQTPTLQALLDNWNQLAPPLAARREALEAEGWRSAEPFDPARCLAPLPRAFQWADASVYRNHARLMYQWRQEPIPPRYEDEPLVYQGGSDVMLGPCQPIVAVDEAHQIDLEAEIAIITTDVPMGVSVEQAASCVALVVLLNDVSLRALIGPELAKGFGFYQSKPATGFAPFAVTPAALGDAWRDGTPTLRVRTEINGTAFGSLDAGSELVFNFPSILAHLARTRSLAAGSIVGLGTISNSDPASGSACITEARVKAQLAGLPEDAWTPYLRHGDRVRIWAEDAKGQNLFGILDQEVRIAAPGRPS